MSVEPDVRIGDYLYALAEGYFDETGLRPMRRRWGSIFAGRQNVSGAPGVQNVQDEDLRWLLDSFAGGEGQRVIDPTEDLSFRRFEQATNIDFANTGEMRLARQLEQYSVTGGTVTTTEGSSWASDGGSSTVVGSDRRIDTTGSAVKVDTGSLGAGQWQLDFFAFINADATIQGDALVEEEKNTQVSGSDIRLKSRGAIARTVNQDPADGLVTVTATIKMPGVATGKATATVKLIVYNQTNQEKVAEKRIGIVAKDVEVVVSGAVKFTAKAGKTYRYKVVCSALNQTADYVVVDNLSISEGAGAIAKWQVKQGSTVIAEGEVNMSGMSTSTRIASASVPSGSYTMRVEWVKAGNKLLVDKAQWQLATIADPRVLELGLDNMAWVADSSGRVHYWDAAQQKWIFVSALGGGADTPNAMGHSDHYQFVAMSDKKIYRAAPPSTGAVYTVAMADPIVGVVVGGTRLLILTESVAAGTRLYETGLESTPTVTPEEKYAVGNTGMGATDDLPQRMAATKNGAVFFANLGPDCWVYDWDGDAGEPFEKLPTGFRGRAIAHSGGLSYVGGTFPTVDSNGDTNHRPAIFVIDHANTGAVQLDVKLHRDEDLSTQIQAMQMYGSDLYVLCGVAGAVSRMRLWRISLRTPVAPFLQQEVDPQDTSGEARGLAITDQDAFLAWSTGGPFWRTTGYNIVDPAEYHSSRYHFGLTEIKRIDEIEVVADIPLGCSVQVSYKTDDADEFTLIGTFTQAGKLPVSVPGEAVKCRSVQFMVQLLSPDPTLTPVVYTVGSSAYLSTSYDRRFELMLACLDQTSVWHLDGTQATGEEGIDYLFDLAESGELVEFEDRYSSHDSKRWLETVVSVQNPDAFYVRKGEALLRVALKERLGA